jgi:tetratricopeptide (TPR) repeat protein
MEREVYSREDIGNLLSKFVPLKVNATLHTDFVRKYQVEAFPTALVLNSDGRVLDIVEGYIPAGRFEEKIKPLAAGENPLEALERKAAGDPESATTQLQVGYQFLSRRWYERSRSYFSKGLELAVDDPVLEEEAMRLIIASHLYESNLEDVVEWVERYRKSFPDSEFLGPMYFDLGQIHFEREEYAQAAEYFEKAKDVADEYMLRMRANWMLSEARGKMVE